ncbi:MAG: methyltransferase [Candidatus Binatia bacterium]
MTSTRQTGPAETEIAGYPAVLAIVELGPPGAPPTWSLPCYEVADLERLVDRGALLNAETVPDPPYWALTWTGAKAIARALLADPPTTPRRVLDLGCGLGLAGVAAGLAGDRVTFADRVPHCLDFARANAELNGLSEFDTIRVDFACDRLERRFDLILAADIVYEPANYRALADFLDLHLEAYGSILLTETLRADATRFLGTMIAKGYADRKTAEWVMEEGRRERTWLHVLRPAGHGA